MLFLHLQDDRSFNEQSINDQHQSTNRDQLSPVYDQQETMESQPSTSSIVKAKTELFDDDFNQNVTNHETLYFVSENII